MLHLLVWAARISNAVRLFGIVVELLDVIRLSSLQIVLHLFDCELTCLKLSLKCFHFLLLLVDVSFFPREQIRLLLLFAELIAFLLLLGEHALLTICTVPRTHIIDNVSS